MDNGECRLVSIEKITRAASSCATGSRAVVNGFNPPMIVSGKAVSAVIMQADGISDGLGTARMLGRFLQKPSALGGVAFALSI